MTGRELYDWPSVREQAGNGLAGYGRFSTQVQSMVAKGRIEKIGRGVNTTYRWTGDTVKAPVIVTSTPLPELKLRISKSRNTLTLQFAGLAITIEVAE